MSSHVKYLIKVFKYILNAQIRILNNFKKVLEPPEGYTFFISFISEEVKILL